MEGEHGNLTLVHTFIFISRYYLQPKKFYLWEENPLKKGNKSQWIQNINTEKNVGPNSKKIGQIFQPKECVYIYALLVIWIKLKNKIYI